MVQQELITTAPVPTPKRPTEHDDSVLARAAELMWPKVRDWVIEGDDCDDPDEDKDEYLGQLADAMRFDCDGYALAQALESSGWSPDARLVEILNDASFRKSEAVREATKVWVKENNVTPTRAVGDRVKITVRAVEAIGEIARIDLEAATYSVFCESLGQVRKRDYTPGYVKSFEEVLDP